MHTRLVALLKRPSLILPIIIVIILLAVTLEVLSVRAGAPQPKIVGQLEPEDIRDIKRAISSAQWPTARVCFRKKQYQRLFRFAYRDLAGGGLVEIRSRPGPAGEMAQVQGPNATYMLLRTTNGWHVTLTGFRK
jgi:hypothetical protein